MPGPCDAVSFFVGHPVVAADVDEAWVSEQMADQVDRGVDDPSTGLGRFIAALRRRLGDPPAVADVLTVAPYRPAYLGGDLVPGGEASAAWSAYRTDIRCWRYKALGVDGMFAIGRGPGDRWDVYLRVDSAVGPASHATRELLSAARTLVPDHGLLFGSAPLHDPRVLRTLLGGGFLPICTEVLFLTRPRP